MNRRFVLLAGLAGAVALIWGITSWAGAPNYVTLYHDLELAEAGTVADALTKSAIPYRLASGGSEVQVPESELARARVLVAKEGMPGVGGRPGEEIWDRKQSWGLTELEQRVTYRRGLEGELARTIGTIRGVQRAQVHLVLPESGSLRTRERPAEAAVVLTMKPGFSLSPDAVQGIAMVVSHSVEQLPSDHVAVMDSEGHLLSVPSENGVAFGLTNRQLETQRSVEKYLADKVETMLGTVMGAGLSKVQVSARLNFEQVDRTIESYNPDGAVLSNEQRSETSGDSVAGGGTSTIVNNSYQNSRTIEKIVGSVGGITRLTVAVIVDEKALGKASGSNRSVIDAQVSRLDGLVRNAIGLDSARGDRLTVTAIPFETEALAAILKDSTAKPATPVLVYVDRFSRPVLGIVGIVAAMILALRVLRSPGSTPGGALARGGIRSSAVNVSEPEPELPPVVVDALTAVTTKMKNQVQAESASHPETAAQVIRAWLMETG